MTRRPSRPFQASRVPGVTWRYSTNGTEAWWSLASADARWGWVERVWGTWTAKVANGNPSGLRNRGEVFGTKRQAMRWLETIAIKADRAWRAQERRRVRVFVDDLLAFSTTIERIDVVDATFLPAAVVR